MDKEAQVNGGEGAEVLHGAEDVDNVENNMLIPDR